MNQDNSLQDGDEQQKLRLEISQLRRTMYIPWLSTVLTVVTMLIGWVQFNESLTSEFRKQTIDINSQLQRDADSRQHDFLKYFLEKRNADYVTAVQTAAEIAQWPPNHQELINKFQTLHDGTMKLYEDKLVLNEMAKFLQKMPNVKQEQLEGKSKVKTNELRNGVTDLAEACRKSLYTGVGLPHETLINRNLSK